MPSFLQYQEEARRRTRRLVALYVLCLISIVAFFYFVTVLGMYWAEDGPDMTDARRAELLWQPELLGWVVVVVGAIVGIASLIKSAQLSGGGAAIAESLGARRVAPDTRDRAERRLLNVVEEMAIAARIAIPSVYILDNEQGINAFAAGYSPDDASVTVTAGALREFNREELQSVIGHEFSHILNGDMRLNIRMIATIFGIICISVIGRIAMRLGFEVARAPRRSKDSGSVVALGCGVMLAGLVTWVVGSIGVFFGRLLQATISRQREYLADASSVQFTRNPHAMAAALKVIGASAAHGSVNNAKAAEISHMFFASGLAGLFATHPPLEERIRRYEPAFVGDYAETRAIMKRRAAFRAMSGGADQDEDDENLATLATLHAAGHAVREAARMAPEPTVAKEESDIWPLLRDESLRDASVAPAVLIGALLDEDNAVRNRQISAIDLAMGEPSWSGMAIDWSSRLRALDSKGRRAACEIAVSALRSRSIDENKRLATLLETLIKADGAITPFEFAIMHVLRNRLVPPSVRPAIPNRGEATKAASDVIAMIAFFGAEDDVARAAAYAAGAAALPEGILPRNSATLAYAKAEVSFSAFEKALDVLRGLPPGLKQKVMEAFEKTILEDGEILQTEEELLAAIADGIDAAAYATLLSHVQAH